MRHAEQQQPDEPAHHRAIDADVLQVLADVELDQLRHLLRIPPPHRVLNVLRNERRLIRRQPLHPTLKPVIERLPQRRIPRQRLAQP